MKSANQFFIALAAFLLASCGGGNDGDYYDDPYHDEVYVGGVWRGTLDLSSDGCGLRSPPNFSFTHGVSQVIDSVDLEDEIGRRFYGQLVGDDGFSVDSPGPDISFQGRICLTTYRYRYDSINADDDPTAQVRFFIVGDCPGDHDCETEYAGDGGRF